MEDKQMAEEFLDEKVSKKEILKKDKNEKSVLQRAINLFIWIIVLVWVGICLMDYYNVYQKKNPIFCIKKDVIHYDNGEVKWCLGAGYKVYQYNRKGFTAIEFGPFWRKERSIEGNIK